MENNKIIIPSATAAGTASQPHAFQHSQVQYISPLLLSQFSSSIADDQPPFFASQTDTGSSESRDQHFDDDLLMGYSPLSAVTSSSVFSSYSLSDSDSQQQLQHEHAQGQEQQQHENDLYTNSSPSMSNNDTEYPQTSSDFMMHSLMEEVLREIESSCGSSQNSKASDPENTVASSSSSSESGDNSPRMQQQEDQSSDGSCTNSNNSSNNNSVSYFSPEHLAYTQHVPSARSPAVRKVISQDIVIKYEEPEPEPLTQGELEAKYPWMVMRRRDSMFPGILVSDQDFVSSSSSDGDSCSESDSSEAASNPNDVSNSLGTFGTLKAAKSKDNSYIRVPSSLLCNPYKYDLKITGKDIGRLVSDEKKNVELRLVDADTLITPMTKKDPVTVDSITVADDDTVIFRITLHVCSFHFQKKPFRITLYNTNNNQLLYASPMFRTYARKRVRRNNVLYSKKPKKQQRIVLNNFDSDGTSTQQQSQQTTAAGVSLAHTDSKPDEQMQPVTSPSNCALKPSLQMTNMRPVPSRLELSEPSNAFTSTNFPVPASAFTGVSPEIMAHYQQQLHLHIDRVRNNGCITEVNDNSASLLASLERTRKAIEMLSSLSPMELHALQSYMHGQALMAQKLSSQSG